MFQQSKVTRRFALRSMGLAGMGFAAKRLPGSCEQRQLRLRSAATNRTIRITFELPSAAPW